LEEIKVSRKKSKKITTPGKIRPSRIKYDKNHPPISARLPIEVRDKLRLTLKSRGITLPKLLTSLANGAEIKIIPAEGAKRADFKNGFTAASEYYGVPYKCCKCGQDVIINSPEEKEAASKLMTQAGWGHSNCPDTNPSKDQQDRR
jgi:hypothetical protein